MIKQAEKQKAGEPREEDDSRADTKLHAKKHKSMLGLCVSNRDRRRRRRGGKRRKVHYRGATGEDDEKGI
jgi:hypothetical protein